MIEYKLNKTKVKVFASEYDPKTPYSISEDVLEIFDEILLMPDTHIGKSVPIGFVAKYEEKIIPSIVGVDIGCAMAMYRFPKQNIDFKELEDHINKFVPSGFNVHEYEQNANNIGLEKLSFTPKNMTHIKKSLGTLGGGNHFIEISETEKDMVLTVHTGSRNLGKQVCEHHEDKLGFDQKGFEAFKSEEISKLKTKGAFSEIQTFISNVDRSKFSKAYLEGEELELYLNDMKIAQDYAISNRFNIVKSIMSFFNIKVSQRDVLDVQHNYIDFKNKIIHKGSIDASEDKEILIPLNMRDGSILARGKGNNKWMSSAPHGAGRKMSRGEAKQNIAIDTFKEQMKDVNTFSVGLTTLDEAPDAYKNAEQVMEDSLDTIEIIEILKPLYNFKAK